MSEEKRGSCSKTTFARERREKKQRDRGERADKREEEDAKRQAKKKSHTGESTRAPLVFGGQEHEGTLKKTNKVKHVKQKNEKKNNET